MNIESSILPGLVRKQKESSSKQKLNAGMLEEHISEKLADVCTFSSIFSHKPIYKECLGIMEEYEEQVAAAVMDYTRRRADFNLVTLVCHEISASCPSSTNSTESEVVKPKEKYMSERPDAAQKKGDVIKVVAADWQDRVVNSRNDVVMFHYSSQSSSFFAKMKKNLEAVAAKIGHCEDLTIGMINTGLNEIPPPYGDYLAEGGYTLCTWRHADRNKPRFLKDLREGDVTVYDLLDFVFNSVSLPSVFTCIAEVSGSTSKEEISKMREAPDDEL